VLLVRKQLAGFTAIESALAAHEPVRVLLVSRDDRSPETRTLIESARARGADIWLGGAGDLRRMSRGGASERAIAMLGPEPRTDLDGLFTRAGAVWLLHRASYPSNVGFAVRTAEVSGADGVVVEAAFNHDDRTRVSHVSMGADRLLPVLWHAAEPTLALAERRGYRAIAIEDVGTRAPWEIDLTGPVVFVVGSERDGLGASLLARCDAVVRIPMAGFVPSYNLQAAISAVAAERLRQLATRSRAGAAR
jgi:23S rRNA (guanosine2251-2'-O)-methyltransferase